MRLVRGVDAPRVRWRNDGGWTREIARDSLSGESFGWRLSIADVESDGPFSAFDGYDRLLVLVAGAGMDLAVAETGEIMRLRPTRRRARFAGESAIAATLIDGPTTDFNVIWDRDRFHVSERHDWTNASHVSDADSVVVVHVVSGVVTADGVVTGVAGDTLISERGEQAGLAGTGEAIVLLVIQTHD